MMGWSFLAVYYVVYAAALITFRTRITTTYILIEFETGPDFVAG